MRELLGSPPTIDYAPPHCRRWLTRRTVSLSILLIASLATAWVVWPRVSHRLELLSLQRQVAAGFEAGRAVVQSSVDDETGSRSENGQTLPALRDYERFALGRKTTVFAAYHGLLLAVEGDERLIMIAADKVSAYAHRPPEATLTWRVIKPATLLRGPRVINSGVVGPLPLPFDGNGPIRTHFGRQFEGDSARVAVEFVRGQARPRDDASPDTVPGLGDPWTPRRRATVTFHLRPDDTLAFEWPSESEPVR